MVEKTAHMKAATWGENSAVQMAAWKAARTAARSEQPWAAHSVAEWVEKMARRLAAPKAALTVPSWVGRWAP